MTPLHFPESVSGRLRVAYLIAGEIARQNGEARPYVQDLGEGRVHIGGPVDLGAVVDALLAAAPPETPLWWNDGPILDAASEACLAVLCDSANHTHAAAAKCAAAALQVAHRAGYAPCREVAISGVPVDHEVVLFYPIGGGDPVPLKGAPIPPADQTALVVARVEAALDADQRSADT